MSNVAKYTTTTYIYVYDIISIKTVSIVLYITNTLDIHMV